MTLNASALGTIAASEIHTSLHIEDAHSTEFVPTHPLTMTTECTATVANSFHAISIAHCAIPNGSNPPRLTLSGSLSDIRHPGPATITAELPATNANDLVGILQTLSPRIPERLILGGTASGSLTWQTGDTQSPTLTGSLTLKAGSIQSSADARNPIQLGDLTLRPADEPAR